MKLEYCSATDIKVELHDIKVELHDMPIQEPKNVIVVQKDMYA